MSEEKGAKARQRALASRTGASRKLLARKASEHALESGPGPGIECSFPEANPNLPGGISTGLPSAGRHPVAQQKLRAGRITPNPNTVAAAIAQIVVERGEVTRSELLQVMREAAFSHPAARPQDRGWCQGYVAGAIRSGFLVVAAEREEQHARELVVEGVVAEGVRLLERGAGILAAPGADAGGACGWVAC